MKKILKTIVKVLIIAMTFLSGLITATVIWLIRDWSEMNASELIFHMGQSLGGANPEVVRHYLKTYFLATVLITILAVVVVVIAHKKAKAKIVYTFYVIGSLGLLVFAGYLLESRMGLLSYAKSRVEIEFGAGDDFIGDNYIDPRDVDIVFPEKKRNLIFIFLESTEMTYTDPEHGGAFQEDIIPELTELSKEGEDFSSYDGILNGGVSLQGTNWTMGGMFAQSAGLPLQISLGGNGMESQDEFFPNIVTMGDILQENGYTQKLMIGSEAKFGGRDKYYTQHGSYELLDYNWAVKEDKIPSDYFVWWGYEDEKLFEFAKEELINLSKEDAPFNITLLTADTHFEDGYVCGLCKDEHDGNRYADVFSCSSRQVYDFVSWIQQQDFYENTTIILSGDHLTMDTDFCDNVSGDYKRRTYFNIINGNCQRQTDGERDYTTMDVFPTTLASLGVTIPGDRLGLGTNLYSDKETLIEQYDAVVMDEYMGKPSAFLLDKSNVKITTKDLDKVAHAVFRTENSDGGGTAISLLRISSIGMKSLEKAELSVTRKSTGEISHYDMNISADKTDPNAFNVRANTDLHEEDMDDVKIEIFFTVKDIKDYKVYEWEKDED